MLWADVSWLERWKGLDSFFKLLTIPLLLVQFRRSDRGWQVFAGYGLSCVALLLLSTEFFIFPRTAFLFTHDAAVPVKNAATQSGEFVTCIFGFLYLAIEYFERRRWLWVFGLAALVLAMLANMFFVATGRTALGHHPGAAGRSCYQETERPRRDHCVRRCDFDRRHWLVFVAVFAASHDGNLDRRAKIRSD